MPPKRKQATKVQVDSIDEFIASLPPSEPVKPKPKKEKLPPKLRKLKELQEIFPDIESTVLEIFLEENDMNVERTIDMLLVQQVNYVPTQLQKPEKKKKKQQLSKEEISRRQWSAYTKKQNEGPKSLQSEFEKTLSSLSPSNLSPSSTSPIAELETSELCESTETSKSRKMNMGDKLKISYLIDLFKGIVDEETIKQLYKDLDGNLELLLWVLTDGRDDLREKLNLTNAPGDQNIQSETNESISNNDENEKRNQSNLPYVWGMKSGESEMHFVERMNREIIQLSQERSQCSKLVSQAKRGSAQANDIHSSINDITKKIQYRQQQVINVYLRMLLRKTGDHTNKCLEIDLHGYSEKEAISALEQTLDTIGITGVGKVRFITGKGKHSGNSYSLIKQKMIQYLNKYQMEYVSDDASITVFLV